MNISTTDLSAIYIQSDENISTIKLNTVFNKLLKNDIQLYRPSRISPTVWECRWFNVEDEDEKNEMGYKNGDSVWYNTEYDLQFISHYSGKIYNYAFKNKYLKNKIKPFNMNNIEIVEFYRTLLKGYVDMTNNIRLSAIYDIGDISQLPQIRISRHDNNTYPVSDDEHWKDFFVYDIKDIIDNNSGLVMNELLRDHIANYHMNEKIATGDVEDYYLLKDMSNIKSPQKYTKHDEKTDMSGFDYVRNFKYDYRNYYEKTDLLQAYDVGENKDLINDEKAQFASEQHIRLIEVVSSYATYHNRFFDGMTTEQIRYRLSSELSGFNNFNLCSYNPLSDKYEITGGFHSVLSTIPDQMTIGGINFQAKSEDDVIPSYVDYQDLSIVQDPQKYNIYYNTEHFYPISTLKYNDIKNVYSTDYTSSLTEVKYMISEDDDSIRREYTKIGSWVREWNSGLVEQGGVVHVDDNYNWIKVNLISSYNYPKAQYDVNGVYDKYTDGTAVENKGLLMPDNRYTISITPVFISSNCYESGNVTDVEACDITNDSFRVQFDDTNKPDYINYYTRGFVENT